MELLKEVYERRRKYFEKLEAEKQLRRKYL